MKLLMENWRKFLLTEISLDDAKAALDSKTTKNIIKNYNYESGNPPEENLAKYHHSFKEWLYDLVPDDLTGGQKALSILWIRNLAKKDSVLAADLIHGDVSGVAGGTYGNVWPDLETFFHHQRFMPQQDLHQVKSLEDLHKMAEEAKEDIQAHQAKKQYFDAEAGTETFRDDDEWFIAALHNKGAACEFGKATDWCTAAPGLNYFEEYYEEDDPLFYFENKKNLNKFQFHYGSDSFMDSKDKTVSGEDFNILHNLLKQTSAYQKYPALREYDFYDLIKQPESSIEEIKELLYSFEEPDQIAVMAAHWRTTAQPHVLEMLAGKEFENIPGVAINLVANAYTPHHVLKDLAQNNPYGALRKRAEEEIVHRQTAY